jgi:hypothetical protein
MIDLEFDSSNGAESFLAALRGMGDRVQDRFEWTESPGAPILEVAESKEY